MPAPNSQQTALSIAPTRSRARFTALQTLVWLQGLPSQMVQPLLPSLPRQRGPHKGPGRASQRLLPWQGAQQLQRPPQGLRHISRSMILLSLTLMPERLQEPLPQQDWMIPMRMPAHLITQPNRSRQARSMTSSVSQAALRASTASSCSMRPYPRAAAAPTAQTWPWSCTGAPCMQTTLSGQSTLLLALTRAWPSMKGWRLRTRCSLLLLHGKLACPCSASTDCIWRKHVFCTCCTCTCAEACRRPSLNWLMCCCGHAQTMCCAGPDSKSD